MTDAQDALQLAIDELAGDMVPTPDDVLENIGPLGCLHYLTQMAAFVMGRWVGTIDSEAGAELQDDDGPLRALQAITLAMGNLTGACVLVDILPPEAEKIPNDTQATT